MRRHEESGSVLGEAVYRFRVRENLTQRALAEKLGISVNTVHMWETGGSVPSVMSRHRLSEVTGWSMAEIFRMCEQK